LTREVGGGRYHTVTNNFIRVLDGIVVRFCAVVHQWSVLWVGCSSAGLLVLALKGSAAAKSVRVVDGDVVGIVTCAEIRPHHLQAANDAASGIHFLVVWAEAVLCTQKGYHAMSDTACWPTQSDAVHHDSMNLSVLCASSQEIRDTTIE
jgi:hypothetical protein